jgi:hypothetical protein
MSLTFEDYEAAFLYDRIPVHTAKRILCYRNLAPSWVDACRLLKEGIHDGFLSLQDGYIRVLEREGEDENTDI